MKHAVMNRSVAMEAQQLGPACRDGRQDDGEVVPSLVDETASGLAETGGRPGTIAVLLDQARMARRFPAPADCLSTSASCAAAIVLGLPPRTVFSVVAV